jgi:hypothetical protein
VYTEINKETKMNNQVEMFMTANDTAKWAVIVDGYFQLFDRKAEAEAMYDKLVPDDIESSNFGSIQLLPPHYAPSFAAPKYARKLDQISLHEQTNLTAYAAEKERELQARIAAHEPTKEQQEENENFFRKIYGDL